MIGVAGIVFGVGLYRSNSQTRVYQAQGQVQLPSTSTANGAGSTSDVDTQVGIIASPVVHGAAARTAPGIGQVTAQQAGLGNIITVTATSTVPAQAAPHCERDDGRVRRLRPQAGREGGDRFAAAVAQSRVKLAATADQCAECATICAGQRSRGAA